MQIGSVNYSQLIVGLQPLRNFGVTKAQRCSHDRVFRTYRHLLVK